MENLQSFQKIIIAVDDSKYAYQAAAYGFALAKKLSANVALIHVNEIPIAMNVTGDPMLGDPGMILPDIMDLQKKASKELFNKLKAEFGSELIANEYIVDGSPSDQIVATAKEFGASLIILGTHGRTGFDHFISGSVAESVSRHAHCPVLIVPNKD